MFVTVRVSTNSDKPCVEKIGDAEFKVKVKAKPVDGKANAEVCMRLAEHFGVPVSCVAVVRGVSNNKKTVRIDGVSEARPAQRLL
ncbi:DUF167 domain-containing protein [Candidatus Micrarchaeota archaeon]|nr:DUF167 domain-containing protein [Candidatus Micrarchaeota archaeon]